MIKIKIFKTSFNVLDQPWMPILDDNGSVQNYGIIEVLLNSHNLVEIKDQSPLFQFGMYRLLTTIIADIYRPESIKGIRDVLRMGQFDQEKIIEYFADKRNRFDLFDKEYPFLQVKPDPNHENDEKIKSVAELLPQMPTGNNRTLFVHKLQGEHAVSPEICAKALCTIGLFSTASVQGYASGVNGAPPWYVLVNGKTLFETLILNVCTPQIEFPLYDENVAWMSKHKIEKKDVAEISYIEGLMWQTRRISLIAEPEKGICTYSGKEDTLLIRNIYFQQGTNFTGYNIWRDPHTSNYSNEQGRGSLKPQSNKSLWRDIGALLLLQNYEAEKKQIFRPQVVTQYLDLIKGKYIPFSPMVSIEAFGMATNQASILAWQHEKTSVPTSIAESSERGQATARELQCSLENCEAVARLIKGVMNNFYSESKKNKNTNTLGTQTETDFWEAMKTIFFTKYIPDADEALLNSSPDNIEWLPELRIQWDGILKQTAKKIIEKAIDQLGLDAETLKMSVRAKFNLNIGISKILNKKGGEQ